MVGRLVQNEGKVVSRIQRVASGLFVLRYVGSNASHPPTVTIEIDATAPVTVLCDLHAERPILRSFGDAVVVYAQQESFVRLLVRPVTTSSGTDAQLVLERVACSIDPVSYGSLAFDRGENPFAAPPVGPAVSVLAHVSRRGDVAVRNGEWLCGPSAPLAIEGFEILWADKPAGVDILSSAVINHGGRRVVGPAHVGEFIGTRQKAAPIVGITLNLTGPAAHQFTLRVEALFLGGSVIQKSGIFVDLQGSSGIEPLVGLRLVVVSVEETQLQEPVRYSATPAKPAPVTAPSLPQEVFSAHHMNPVGSLQPRIVEVPKSGRVRIFRATRDRNPNSASVE